MNRKYFIEFSFPKIANLPFYFPTFRENTNVTLKDKSKVIQERLAIIWNVYLNKYFLFDNVMKTEITIRKVKWKITIIAIQSCANTYVTIARTFKINFTSFTFYYICIVECHRFFKTFVCIFFRWHSSCP